MVGAAIVHVVARNLHSARIHQCLVWRETDLNPGQERSTSWLARASATDGEQPLDGQGSVAVTGQLRPFVRAAEISRKQSPAGEVKFRLEA